MQADRQRRLRQLIQLRRARRLLHDAVYLGIPEITVFRLKRRLQRRAAELDAPLFIGTLLR